MEQIEQLVLSVDSQDESPVGPSPGWAARQAAVYCVCQMAMENSCIREACIGLCRNLQLLVNEGPTGAA